MPLYKTITVAPGTKVLIWKIEESKEDLMKGIEATKNCISRLSHMKSEIHQRGFLSVRHLLKAAGYKASDLYYDGFGKPHLKDGKYISITHSFIFSGIIVSDDIKVGIDIEKQREKISVIAHKFVDYEYNYLTDEDIRKLTVVWCVKESLYKVFAREGMSFIQHVKVIPFELNDKKTVGWVYYESIIKKYKLNFLEFDGFTCAYALEDGFQ
ncbi:4'-phosphopantetheinyl transferase superfamily protein [Galbibacter sp. EGI 63066]|uniref:4'-phosphopantetheinyl transferase family protein n=1 Tax=Galbibacter sp. EGI 63066 TaxID=2993559 RepID=UPI0022492B61|nr:4'-phosphopantetheinyl transferase family protein [Galbibacter sp. EGI 63066]MCX2681029.1 4'-phosphopantetheinyl transferase superfamily protein [Galbibacter sp. EGI 63066]